MRTTVAFSITGGIIFLIIFYVVLPALHSAWDFTTSGFNAGLRPPTFDTGVLPRTAWGFAL